MADVDFKADLKPFLDVIRTLELEFGKDASHIANKILSAIAFRSARLTRKASPARIRQELNRVVRKYRIDGRMRTIRLKHVLAIATLRRGGKGRGNFPRWEEIRDIGNRIVSRRRSAAGFLRAGWIYSAVQLRKSAGGFKDGRGSGTREGVSGRTRGGARWGSFEAAKGRRARATAENRAPSVLYGMGDDVQRYQAIGEHGLSHAASEQLAIEQRSLAKALERKALRIARRGR